MYLLADLRDHSFDLVDPSDCLRFSVRVLGEGSKEDLAVTLGECAVVEGDHAWVEVSVIRRLALLATDESWDADFAAMLDYARTNGWLDDDGGRIRVHIEWPTTAP